MTAQAIKKSIIELALIMFSQPSTRKFSIPLDRCNIRRIFNEEAEKKKTMECTHGPVSVFKNECSYKA